MVTEPTACQAREGLCELWPYAGMDVNAERQRGRFKVYSPIMPLPCPAFPGARGRV